MSDNNLQGESMDQKERIFLIPSPNMSTFEERFAKLVKRANKIGCEVPSFVILKEEPKTIQVEVDRIEDDFGREKVIYEDKVILIHHIKFNTSQVIVAGYEFLCTIEHLEEGNALHIRRGVEGMVPKQYRDAKPWCDHCKILRRRNDTFVVRKVDDGSCLQIGRNCLSDYLGKDATRYAAAAELYFEIDELGEASEGEGGGGWGSGGPQYDYLESYLAHVAETISRHGWKSNTTARDYGGVSTSNFAYRHFHPSKEDIRDNNLEWRTPSEKSLELAKEAIVWCESISDEEVDASDYLYNIRTIARRGLISSRQFGYSASIVSGYQKYLGTLIRKQRFAEQALISQYVGTVGEKGIFDLLVEKIITSHNDYGTSYTHLMVDRSGNRFVWFANSGNKLQDNQDVILRGTIKKHGERDGVKQTTLTRCSEVVMKNFKCDLFHKDGTWMVSYEFKAETEKDARKMLCDTLNVKRLPKGTTVSESAEVPAEPVLTPES